MSYLIDTHVLIWYLSGNKKLSKIFIDTIENQSNRIIVSKVSLWEIAIKISLGKLNLGIPFNELEDFLIKSRFEEIDFNSDDLKQVIELPFYHRDPFDRLIISQAISRNLTILTDDPAFKSYSAQLLS